MYDRRQHEAWEQSWVHGPEETIIDRYADRVAEMSDDMLEVELTTLTSALRHGDYRSRWACEECLRVAEAEVYERSGALQQ